jgi:phycoerythrin-associated linker protein
VPRYRAIELNYRHLLGRAPDGYDEMKQQSAILDAAGFEAEIDSYIDSDEYQNRFGENFVPYIHGYKSQGKSMVQFTHTFELVRGASSSSLKGNLAGKSPRLNSLVIQSIATPIISPASSGATFRTPPGVSRSRHGVGGRQGLPD